MKAAIAILFIIPLSINLLAQENKKSIHVPEKYRNEFDKTKLDRLYPESEFKKSPIAGIWVEENGNTDTLIFKPYYDGQEPVFSLERGLDKHNMLPKANSGPYHYRIEDGFIRIQWFLSSTISYNPYIIVLSNDSSKMKIGDFYSSQDQNNDTLTFIRVDYKN